jgi:hypothetical protein
VLERRSTRLAVALLAAAAVVLMSSRADAIPAFARRYETSCQTCHIAFPRLTPFGEAFLRNGYRFPARGDAASQKEEPTSLGSDAHKDLWPESAVYPGQIPGKFPLSLALDAKLSIGPRIEGHGNAGATGHGAPAHDGAASSGQGAQDSHPETTMRLTDLGGVARVLAGGVLGDIASFFFSVAFSNTEPVMIERGAVTLTPLTPVNPALLHVKVGRFEPALHGVSIHRGLLGHQLRLTTSMTMLNPFMPEHALTGVQISGVALGRLGWYGGMVENAAPVEGIAKDVYGRLELKMGGMPLDGVDGKAASRPWREISLMVGGSIYHGKALVTYPMAGMPEMNESHPDTFDRFGLDAHVVLEDVLVDLVVARQKHKAPQDLLDDPRTTDLAYAEVTVMTLPWFFPTARFEGSRLLGGPESRAPRWIGILGLNTLVRPNILVRGESGVGADTGEHAGFRYGALTLSVAL